MHGYTCLHLFSETSSETFVRIYAAIIYEYKTVSQRSKPGPFPGIFKLYNGCITFSERDE